MSGSEYPPAEFTAEIGRLARERLGPSDGAAFATRMARVLPDVVGPLDQLYGSLTDIGRFIRSLVIDALDFAAAREESLRALDHRRAADPSWFQDQRMVGYVCYADRFGATLPGTRAHLDYLDELGVTYLHLMPVLAPREGENDGGYAVLDYDAVDPRLGTMADLTNLADDLHRRGIALCIDLVLNHTAREHEWAQHAIAGDPFYRDFYLVFPDRTMPDAYERTLPEIFPELAPGTFTHSAELDGWVWTTFRDFQWDLNYANPEVFRAMLATMLRLANRGADILRLDAAPFLWKRLGTDCQDQPEAHLLLQAFRGLTRIAAPGLLLKAEAMVAPDILTRYLGDHDEYRRECDLAYDNQLMVMLWSGFATGDARLAAQALQRRRPAPTSTSWVTYVRCHDDIGWAVADADAAAVGLTGPAHRRFLSDFYAGSIPDSFANGARFQINRLGESPISGTAASLCGVEAAIASGAPATLELAIRRLETLYSVVFSFGGIPLIYMGDELALLNDRRWQQDPVHESDNRWMHRPPMDWPAADRRHDQLSLEGRTFARLARLSAARASQPALRSGGPTVVVASGNPRVLAYRRGQDSRPFLGLVNFSDSAERVAGDVAARAGIADPVHAHSSMGSLTLVDGRVELPPCGFLWLSSGRAGDR